MSSNVPCDILFLERNAKNTLAYIYLNAFYLIAIIPITLFLPEEITMELILVILLTLILFLAMILLLASQPKYASRITRTFIVVAGIGGILFYGYGFAATTDHFWLATIRALLAVCGMYVGKMDLASISTAPLMQYSHMQLLFWIVHLLALYATASTAITTVGAEALRKLRLWLARRGTLHLIYGVSDDTLDLAREILKQKQVSVVFVDTKANAGNAAAIAKAGCVLRSDNSALQADAAFLRSIGAHRKNRSIHVYALEGLTADNLHYAQRLLKTLKENAVTPDQTSLVIRACENSEASALQALGDQYGYGTVTVVQEASLAARTLIYHFPPCDYIHFDENGRASDDFEAIIIGFGQVGQSVLRHLVMNGQFEGSCFRAAVFAPNCDAVMGHFSRSYPQVLKNYDISIHAYDARSEQFYDYLSKRAEQLKYIAICTSDETMNLEIAENLMDYLYNAGLDIPLFLCSHRNIQHFNAQKQDRKHFCLYRPEVLSMQEMDKLAMLVNSHYQANPTKSPEEHWRHCDYFSRMSCRATADFVPAMLRMAGLTETQVQKEGWVLTEAQLENMSRTEHLRWCAFHFCMGFSPMTPEEYDARAASYLQQVAAGKKPLRIGKNMRQHTHACLIDWEELDALSLRESSLTGQKINYKAADRENVRLIPELLQTRKKTEV